MTSFLVRKLSTLVRSFCSLSMSCCCWASSSVDLRVEALELVLGQGLALQRRAGEVLLAGGERLAGLGVELDDLLLEL